MLVGFAAPALPRVSSPFVKESVGVRPVAAPAIPPAFPQRSRTCRYGLWHYAAVGPFCLSTDGGAREGGNAREVDGGPADRDLSRSRHANGGGGSKGRTGSSCDSEDGDPRQTITESAILDLPFPAEVAFSAFSDLPRQPSWSKWLKSVEYLNDHERTSPIPTSRWTAQLFGLRYSWTAVVTEYVPGRSMGWKSTSGMRTAGRVVFDPMDGEDYGSCCRVTLTMTLQAPRAIAAIFRRSGALERYFENRILGGTLRKFRDVVLEQDVRGGGDKPP